MKITDVKHIPVSHGWAGYQLVKVETDEGIYGWGEAGVSSRELAVAGAIQHYREWLIGRDPLQRGALWQEMYRSQYFEGGRVLTAAISGIDIALHDIAGKALGVPVYQLLGGRQRDRVPCFATADAEMGPALIEEVKEWLAVGWPVVRVFPSMPGTGRDAGLWEPRESIPHTAHWLARLREEVGPEAVLGIDYHHRLNVVEAASFCQRLPRGTLDFVEEPIRDQTPDAYQMLRAMTDVPFAIGEECASKWDFLPYIERGLTNYARLDICNIGGFTEAMKVAGWAEAHYIDLMPHNPLGPICTAATVHLGAAVPNWAWMEVIATPDNRPEPELDALFPVRPRLQGSCYPVPDLPGLGIEVDEAYASRSPFQPFELPHLRRRDGSLTNW
ncbi:MAG: mandelate racemase/muconate lactonizing enzyme family protein [Anaerolineae bacterium]